MKYHCGLLDARPDQSRTLKWIRTPAWGHRPPEIEHELKVWLAMPGFSIAYHAHVLGHSKLIVARHMGGFEEMRDDVVENWLSITREDCLALARLRPNQGSMPLVCQLRALQDLKTLGAVVVARDYRTTLQTLRMWRTRGLATRGPVPAGFELLISP